ncbi:Cytochrome C oxidase, cbb3-type, subunit III [Dyadobacter sp. SG02]|uniref:c-type cytochrome n=1 Tax=Dyadobacter sp. SG02 TaxID=1855291 RepID=UPI0008D22C83|nr:cytochrome c [Dyadobacter sp. SG02]SEJ00383.1 Cytochrome C oxidase, cbb3-type, subunit III [Dyadobacter sp. SG02]
MLKKILKWTGRALLVVLLLAIGYYTKAYITIGSRKNKVYAVKPVKLDIPTDSATIAMGKRLVTVKGCTDCHGKDLGGKVLFEQKGIGRLTGRNLTKGKGGVPRDFDTEDWVRAIRHGLQRNGTPLIYMPSAGFNQLSETDLKAVIAYCAQAPSVDREVPPSEIGVGATILADLGELELFEAEKIDHTLAPPLAIREGVTADFGKYVSQICTGCHKPDMKGTPGDGGTPNISSSGPSAHWTDEQFFQTLRTGKRPDGTELKAPMPWQMTAAFSDTEMRALRVYLKSI